MLHDHHRDSYVHSPEFRDDFKSLLAAVVALAPLLSKGITTMKTTTKGKAG